ncbi:MAG: hypothetical protein IJT16_06440 [Lachnospiraceae bacterium]|nr:hypothetical protein [Lachnospiraceae bacterium]
MEWKPGVEILRDKGVRIRLGSREKEVEEEDMEILEFMGSGICDDDELLKKVAESSGSDLASCGFRLAQFVENYGDFIAKGTKSKVFEIL